MYQNKYLRMKKVVLFMLLAALVMTSCQDKNTYTLTGKLETGDWEGKTVYLQTRDYRQMKLVSLDSTQIKDNQFKFKEMAPDTPLVYFVNFSNEAEPAVIIAEPGKIELTIDSTLTAHVKGTPSNNEYQQFVDEIHQLIDESQDMFSSLEKDLEEEKITVVQLDEKRKSYMEKFNNKIYEFVKPNIQKPVGEFVFVDNGYMLKPEQIIELISIATPNLKSREDIQQLEKMATAQVACSVGKQFVDIQGKTIDGKDMALSDYAGKGKIVLIDFWASWCGPCIKAMPDVVAAYQKFKNKGFEIVGVSLDTNKEKWENASVKHKVTWPQFSNLQGWKDEAAQAYGITSIPATILIDKNGIIIDKDIEGKSLSGKLEELLK